MDRNVRDQVVCFMRLFISCLVGLITGCGELLSSRSVVEYSYVENGIYQNDILGMRFEIPATWSITPKDLLQKSQPIDSRRSSIFRMNLTSKSSTLPFVYCYTYDSWRESSAKYLQKYITDTRGSVPAHEEIVNGEIGGREYAFYQGGRFGQRSLVHYVTVRRGYAVLFIFAYDELSQLEDVRAFLNIIQWD